MVGVEWHGREAGAGQRNARGVVGVVGVGQQNRVALLGERERQLGESGLRSRHDCDLGLGIDLDAVLAPITGGERLAAAPHPADRGVAVGAGVDSPFAECLDDVGRRADVGVAAAEVDERRPGFRRRIGNPAEQLDEVLLRQSVQPLRTGAHRHGLLLAAAGSTCGGSLESEDVRRGPRRAAHALGGSVASDIMWSLAHEQGIALPTRDYWEFDRMVTVSDPRGVADLDALDRIYHLTELIQSSPLAVERSVHAAIGGAYRSQRITTLELRFNPMKRNRGGERDLDHIILAAVRDSTSRRSSTRRSAQA